jgi:TolB protein
MSHAFRLTLGALLSAALGLAAGSAHAELKTSAVTLGYGKASPSMNPDGKRLAFGWSRSDKQGGDIFMVDVTAPDSVIPLTASPKRDNEPVWSPNGKEFAFMSGRSGDEDIWVYDVETGKARQLTFSPWGPYDRAQEFGAAWSPDGKRIAYSSDRSGDDDIWWMPAEGGGEPVRVTKRTNPLVRDEDRFPSWSPDSKRIVFTSKRSGTWDLWIATVDDTSIAPVQLTADSTEEWLPAWSPNGRWIAFVSDRTGSPDIFVMPAEGGAAKQVTQNPGQDTQPCWSWDGKRIFYSAQRGGDHGIYVIDGLDALLGAGFAAPSGKSSRGAPNSRAASR